MARNRLSWPVSRNLLRWPEEDAGASLLKFASEQEEPWQPFYESTPWSARPYLDDDLYPSLLAALEDEAAGNAPVSVAWAYAAATTDEHAASPLANFALEQEDDWNKAVQTVTWSARPQLDDEYSTALANFGLEDERAYAASIQLLPWSPVVLADEHAAEPLANFALEQEEPWAPAFLAAPLYAFRAPDDEQLSRQPVGLEDESGYVFTQSVVWVAAPRLDEHAGSSLANFGLEYEDAARTPLQVFVTYTPAFSQEEPLPTAAPTPTAAPIVGLRYVGKRKPKQGDGILSRKQKDIDIAMAIMLMEGVM